MRRIGFWVPLLVLLDQASKLWVVRHFNLGDSVPVIPGILHFTYVQNTGAAFGILKGQRWLFVVLALVVVVWVLYSCRHAAADKLSFWGGLLVASGALGNLIDRVFLGYVIDFIDLRVWPVFNIADSCITVGVLLLVWMTLRPKAADRGS